uniref:Uncharacterized protein n=1 Tax=Bartonella rochalimae ATCC BAA-1498 TaxID=685782 RepID=E6YNA5_9HYPH|nr:hypothetical protein BARRO_120117 [Bartonella rochalimae ATCC BAA-1498]
MESPPIASTLILLLVSSFSLYVPLYMLSFLHMLSFLTKNSFSTSF